MKYFLFLLVLIFSFNIALSQNTIVKPSNSSQSYDEYFRIPRESLYLHLNKSSYLRGEDIWFQGYAYDRKIQNLNPETRNIEVGVYDNEGKIIDQKLFLAINGLFTGQISIDSTYADGNYYLKAETNYMKNFKEDYTHIQRFEVLGEGQIEDIIRLKDYDLQILPEGGQIVYNRKSTLGLKLINQNGLGENFEAELLENEKPIIKFSSNRFGHAKVEFTPKENNNYTIKTILTNNKIITERINDIQQHGFVLRINNILPERTIIDVAASIPAGQTYESIDAKIMVHQEGKYFDIPLLFSDKDTELVKSIKREQLFKGVNTITLVVNNKPIAERLIFNRTGLLDNPDDIDISILPNTSKDTLGLKLNIPGFEKNSNLSISVLPEKTISYVKNHNISSSFLLDPFVNGYVEGKTYYFQNSNKRVDYDLDLLLMIQGWSKYEWDNIINDAPKMNYPRNEGISQTITLNGRVRSKIDKLLVYGMIYNKNQILDINDQKEFKLQNRYPLKGERMELSYITNKKEFLKPDLTINSLINFNHTKLDSTDLLPSISSLRNEKLNLSNKELYSSFLMGELLDEVTVKTRLEKEAKSEVSSFKDNTAVVDEDFVNTYPTLADFLSTKGYLVTDGIGNFSINTASRVSLSGSNSPAVFLNGVLLNDLGILSGSRTSDYKEIFVDRTGYGAGVQAAAGVIRLEQRTDALFTGDNETAPEPTYLEHKIEKGFEPPKLFYTPEYSFFETKAFQQIGVLGWFPDVALKADESAELNIFDTGLEDMTLFIEGIAEDGSLINITKSINLTDLQNDGIKLSILNKYYKYFEKPRESLYLHLNKSSYVRGDNIWFQGYAYNRKTQKLNPDTRNVELGVYDEAGKLIDKKLFLAEDGLFRGQIAIDSTFADGNYYLKADTHYMKNFKEDFAHIQQFEVIGQGQISEQQSVNEYDFQILPEGGHSVMNCKSQLGLKLLNQNGLGIKFRAELLENDIPILDIESNRFGHAKVEFLPRSGNVYHIKATLPRGEIIKKAVEDIKPYGYVLNVNKQTVNKTTIQVSHYLLKEDSFENSNVELMVRQEGKHFSVPVKQGKSPNTTPIIFDDDQLFYGVNTFTLFVDDKPVAERLVFNGYKTKDSSKDVTVNALKTKVQDSIHLQLSLPDFNEDANLSISILPENTISDVKNENISTALLLAHFVKGYIEDKTYYFTETDEKTKTDLDLLLLTQGWSQYKWDDIFNNSPVENFSRMDGFSQRIEIEERIPKRFENLLIWSTTYNENLTLPIDHEKNKYELNNRYPVIGEKFQISLVDTKRKFANPNITLDTSIELENDSIPSYKQLEPLSNLRNIKLELDNDKLYSNFLQGELLDEVVVKAKKEKKDSRVWLYSDFGSTEKVDIELANRFPTLLDYLATKGYFRVGNKIADRPVIIEFVRFPTIFLNGLPIRNQDIIFETRTSDFEEIYIDKSGTYPGADMQSGIINLTWRKTSLYKGEFEQLYPFTEIEIKKGFQSSKEFYMPKYKFFNTPVFQQMGTIAWFSDIAIKVGESVNLTVFDTGLDKLTLYIEGIGEDGSLINIKKAIEL